MIEPWYDAFRQDAEQAIASLLSGRASVGSGFRLDTPELLLQIFSDRQEMALDRERLDDALLKWLLDMRRTYAVQVRRIGFSAYGKRLCDALVALQLLNLPRARNHIREELESWLRWLTPLRLAPERDPALECWRLLTRTQPDTRHTAAWLHLADDLRPEYLTVALAGLERLPNQGDARTNQILILQALLRHAVRSYPTSNTARAFFNRRFAALRGLYSPFPRGPQHWHENLETVLEGFVSTGSGRKERELATQLLADIHKTLRPQKPRKRQAEYPPATREQVQKLAVDIEKSKATLQSLATRFFDILEQNRRHAQSTGNSFDFTWSLHFLGRRLLRRRGLSGEILAQFGRMIERALGWDPINRLSWMLWGDWFKYQGFEDSREWILREMVRLFPDDRPARVELARMLVRRGDLNEAEDWLREAARRGPTDEHARVELARLLMRRGEVHRVEAEQWLREAANLSLSHAASRVELARLLIDRGEEHWDEAEDWLRQAAEHNRRHEPSHVELARLLVRRGEDHWDEAEELLREAARQNPSHEPSRVELARLLIRRGEDHWGEAERWLREAAEYDPNREHSRVELARLLIRKGSDYWDEAERLLRDAGDRNPNRTASRIVLAGLLGRRGRRTEGELIVRRLLEKHPTNKRAQQAIVRMIESLERDPTADVEEGLGVVATASSAADPLERQVDEQTDQVVSLSDASERPFEASLPQAEVPKTPSETEGHETETGEREIETEGRETETEGSEIEAEGRETETEGSETETLEVLPNEVAGPDQASESTLDPSPPALTVDPSPPASTGGSSPPASTVGSSPPAQQPRESVRRFTAQDEIARRGWLAAEFNRARRAAARRQTAEIDRIRKETASGDALAGFYLQWLAPDDVPRAPPHAWAWSACERWQKEVPSTEWKQLEDQFPELSPETTFLRLLKQAEDVGQEDEIDRWLVQYGSDSLALAGPRSGFMRDGLSRLAEIGSRERDEIALAVMASAAARSPEFAS